MYSKVQDAEKRSDAAVRKMREVQESMTSVKMHADDLDSTNTKLVSENKSQEEAIAALQNETRLKEARITELEANNSELRTSIDNLNKKLQVSKDIEGLNVNEFSTLMSSNLQVAQNIERLMGHFSTLQAAMQGRAGAAGLAGQSLQASTIPT